MLCFYHFQSTLLISLFISFNVNAQNLTISSLYFTHDEEVVEELSSVIPDIKQGGLELHNTMVAGETINVHYVAEFDDPNDDRTIGYVYSAFYLVGRGELPDSTHTPIGIHEAGYLNAGSNSLVGTATVPLIGYLGQKSLCAVVNYKRVIEHDNDAPHEGGTHAQTISDNSYSMYVFVVDLPEEGKREGAEEDNGSFTFDEEFATGLSITSHPGTGELVVFRNDCSRAKSEKIQIIDMNGSVRMEAMMSRQQLSFDVANLASGVYIIRAKSAAIPWVKM